MFVVVEQGLAGQKKNVFYAIKKNIFKQCYWTIKFGDIFFSKDDTIFFFGEN